MGVEGGGGGGARRGAEGRLGGVREMHTCRDAHVCEQREQRCEQELVGKRYTTTRRHCARDVRRHCAMRGDTALAIPGATSACSAARKLSRVHALNSPQRDDLWLPGQVIVLDLLAPPLHSQSLDPKRDRFLRRRSPRRHRRLLLPPRLPHPPHRRRQKRLRVACNRRHDAALLDLPVLSHVPEHGVRLARPGGPVAEHRGGEA